MDENNSRIQEHCKEGGYAVVYEHGYVTILKGTWKIRVLKATDIPITFDGKALHKDGQYVFLSYQAGVKERESGDGHKQHQCGGHNHPCRVAAVN